MSITVAKFKDVSEGTQPGQFTVGDREPVTSLADLEPSFRRLLDEPVTAVVAVMGRADQPHLTPVWFDYEGDTVLLNLATHRKKVDWLRKAPLRDLPADEPREHLPLDQHQDRGEAGDLRG